MLSSQGVRQWDRGQWTSPTQGNTLVATFGPSRVRALPCSRPNVVAIIYGPSFTTRKKAGRVLKFWLHCRRKSGDPPFPHTMLHLGMTSDGLGEMYEGVLILMRGRVTSHSVRGREERTPMHLIFMVLHIRCICIKCIHTHNVHFVPRISWKEICW